MESYLLASAGCQKGSRSNHQLIFALPRAREGSHTIAKTHKVTVQLLWSLLQSSFAVALWGLLLDACVLQWLFRAVFAFRFLKAPNEASRLPRRARRCPSIRTHLSFSSCDPGSPTLSGRSRLLLYRPECDNSFSCKAVIFLYLEGWNFIFFLKGGGGSALACVFWLLSWVVPPLFFSSLFQMLPPRNAPAKMPGEKRFVGVSAHLRPPERPTSAGRAGRAGRRPPLLGFLFLIGTHPPEGHHVSFIAGSHLRDVCRKLTACPPASLRTPAAPTGLTPLWGAKPDAHPAPPARSWKSPGLPWAVNSLPL